ncbi:hypothetical protein FRB97_000146 [Tulasnella sp. 331]|nr:hypothetical protein FRB97_000146 [Tulasnella sp. 331]KAG8890867.1 hypothetical protein FRB98_004912 [Tulasnella sp. 332]
MSTTLSTYTPFVPSASLANAPEDVLVQICALISILDILALRLCSRRLYHITRSRIIWLQALQRLYARRFLPPPIKTSQISTPQLEHRATRSWRFLHALADISSAQYNQVSFQVLDEDDERTVRQGQEDHHDTRGIVAVYITPGGRWLSIMLNCKLGKGIRTAVALLVIWDLWNGVRVLKRPFVRPVHFASIRIDDKAAGLELIVGFEKFRNEDPYFSAMFVPLPDDKTVVGGGEQLIVERLGGIKVARSPRACSVHGDLLAFADRIGNMCFWNWREQSSARIFVVGWPPAKGKIMLLAPHLLAVFNPASSSFAVFMVPPLRSINPSASPEPITDDISPAPAHDQNTPQPAPQPLPQLPQTQTVNIPGHEMPQHGPQYPLARFRLPSRGLNITLPSSVRASAYLARNSSFPEPFLAYFILIQPESPSVLHLGIVPELDAQMEEGGPRASSIASDLSDGEVDLASNVADDGNETQAGPSTLQQQHQPQSAMLVSPPLPPAPAPHTVNLPHNDSPDLVAAPAPPAVPADGALLPEMIEPSWLRTLRCTDSTTSDTFSSKGRILHVGPVDHSIAIIRTDDRLGRVEIFTSAAMYAKTESPAASPPRPREEPYFAPNGIRVAEGGNGNGSGSGSGRMRHFAAALPNFGLLLPQPPALLTPSTTPWISGSAASHPMPSYFSAHPYGGSLSSFVLPPIIQHPDAALAPNANPHVVGGGASSTLDELSFEHPSNPPPPPLPSYSLSEHVNDPAFYATTPAYPNIGSTLPNGLRRTSLPARSSITNGMSALRLLPPYQRSSTPSSSSASASASASASSSRSNAPASSSRPIYSAPLPPPPPPPPPPPSTSKTHTSYAHINSSPREAEDLHRSPGSSASNSTSPPHARLGSSIEGDYQYLGYRTSREIHAATVDDVSGKICIVEASKDGYEVVVLDYGWDFWKVDVNDEA